MEVLNKLGSDTADSSSKQQKCISCFRNCLYKKSEKDVRQVFNVCSNYLISEEFDGTFKWNKLKPQERLSPFCSTCFSLGLKLLQINDKLENLQRKLDEHVERFSCKVLQLRKHPFDVETNSFQQIPDDENETPEVKEEIVMSVENDDDAFDDYLDNEHQNYEISSTGNGEEKILTDEEQDLITSACSNVTPEKFGPRECSVSLERLLFPAKEEPLSNGSPNLSRKPSTSVSQTIASKRKKIGPKIGENQQKSKNKRGNTSQSDKVDAQESLNEGNSDQQDGVNEPAVKKVKTKRKATPRRLFKWKCQLCQMNFDSEEKLEAHRQIHEDDIPLECQRCSTQFSDMKSFSDHQWLSQCTLDGLSDSEGSFQCDLCQQSFNAKYLQLIHRLDHTYPERVPIYECHLCDSTFPRKMDLMRHFLIHTDEVPFYCDICCKPYRTVEIIGQHRLTHKGGDCDLFECPTCDMRLKSRHTLKVHMRSHAATKNHYQCQYCDKSFALLGLLNKHLNHHKKTHVCEHCGRSFPEIFHLKQHLLRHTGPKMCGHGNCDKTFTREEYRLKHIEAHHSGIKYYCHKCGKEFNSRPILQTHLRKGTGCGDFPCENCDMVFKTYRLYTLHSYTHTGVDLQCPYCKRLFTQKRIYLRHLNWHAQGKDYQCAECNKIFQTSEGLAAHAVSHTKEKPFKCDDCGVSFARKATFTKHMKNKHVTSTRSPI